MKIRKISTGAMFPLPGPGQQTTDEQAKRNRIQNAIKEVIKEQKIVLKKPKK